MFVGVPAVMVAVAIARQDMPAGERITILGILAFVLASWVALVKSQGSQLVAAVRANTKAQADSTQKLGELVRSIERIEARLDQDHLGDR